METVLVANLVREAVTTHSILMVWVSDKAGVKHTQSKMSSDSWDYISNGLCTSLPTFQHWDMVALSSSKVMLKNHTIEF